MNEIASFWDPRDTCRPKISKQPEDHQNDDNELEHDVPPVRRRGPSRCGQLGATCDFSSTIPDSDSGHVGLLNPIRRDGELTSCVARPTVGASAAAGESRHSYFRDLRPCSASFPFAPLRVRTGMGADAPWLLAPATTPGVEPPIAGMVALRG